MKLGIVIETNDPEKAWNALRFANTARARNHEVQVFLMSAGVEIETIDQEPYNAQAQLETFIADHGVVWACGTCLKSRQQQETAACPISTMLDCVKMVEWADKVVTF